jgi:hypothetical protein
MPFLQLNPQGVRLTPTPTATQSTTATTNGSAPLNTMVDTATAQNLPGMVAWFKDSDGQVSVMAYAIANASIAYGAALQKVTAASLVAATGVASTRVKSGFDNNTVIAGIASCGGYGVGFAGIAAASVINTGAYFWRYISGFVPEATVGSAVASGRFLTNYATTAGALGSLSNFNATSASNATVQIPVAYTVGAAPANGGLASIHLTGWYM